MSIEEKLSTIKAINHEIDECDQSIDKLEKLSLLGIDCLSLHGISQTYEFVQLPNKLEEKIMSLMKDEYRIRKTHLIEKASELMK